MSKQQTNKVRTKKELATFFRHYFRIFDLVNANSFCRSMTFAVLCCARISVLTNHNNAIQLISNKFFAFGFDVARCNSNTFLMFTSKN